MRDLPILIVSYRDMICFQYSSQASISDIIHLSRSEISPSLEHLSFDCRIKYVYISLSFREILLLPSSM